MNPIDFTDSINKLSLRLRRHVLPQLLAFPCERLVPRSGERGATVNCFTVSVDKQGDPYLFVATMHGDEVHGTTWNGSSYAEAITLDLKELDPSSIFVTHFFGLAEVRYFGIFDVAFDRTFFAPYIKIRAIEALSNFDQYLFNKKKLVTKQRMDLLKFLVEQQLEGDNKFETIDLMTKLYSMKWVSHPARDSQRNKLEGYLDSLVATGELNKASGYQYEVTGNALRTIKNTKNKNENTLRM